MSQRKVELLTAFNSNTEMKEAVKEVLLASMYSNGVMKEGEKHNPMLNWALTIGLTDETSNEEKGAKLSAISEGIQFIETAFRKIESDYKAVNIEEGVPKNPAR